MITLSELRKVKTWEDLEELGIGRIYCDISRRGGRIGFYAEDIAEYFGVNIGYLPRKFGAGCNYLGGGLRGVIFTSDFSHNITGRKATLLRELALACVRVYSDVESGEEFANEEYPDGETNWDNIGTNQARKNGTISVY